MRLLLGIILGCALTIGGAYVADHMDRPVAAQPLVNWDVVGKTIDDVGDKARESWKKISG
jgi:hypothetical protein